MATQKKVLVPLAEGFEEIEAVTIIDVLRRAELEVVVAGLTATNVTGAHDIAIEADTELSQVDIEEFDAVVLPGGMPGAKHLRESQKMIALLQKAAGSGKVVAAICAGP